ncbi:MAG: protein kinase [Acidobacteriota bacterium]
MRRARELGTSIGPYRLDAALGRGGMGEVYRAYDARLDRSVALKRVRPGVGDPETALRRFRREARAAARLRHPALVQVHDWLEDDGEAWLVMELVEGRSLRAVLQSGALEEARMLDITRDLLEGLAVAHDAGLVHRDLKPDNVMITAGSSVGRGRGEQAKILDFGLAKSSVARPDETHLSVEGKIIGTLSAMAPEQVLGRPVDGRTDLFALGCLLYEALTCCAPFVGDSAGATLNNICSRRQRPLTDHRGDLSPRLADFVDQLLEKDPRRRPASAHAALDRLDQVVSGRLDLDTALDSPTEGGAFATRLPPKALGRSPAETVAHRRLVPVGSAEPAGGDESGGGREDTAPSVLASSPVPLRRRLAMASWGVAAAIALTWILVARFGGELAPEPIYVAVPPATLHVVGTDAADGSSSASQAELAAVALQTALLQGLVGLRAVVALDVPTSERHDADPRALARALAADEVLASRLDCGVRGCRATLRRVSGADGRVLWAQTFSADPERLLDLGQAATGLLGHAYPESSRHRGAPALEVRPDDYETFLRLRERFRKRDRGFSTESLLEELERLGRTSPRFAAIPVLEAYVWLHRFAVGREAAELENAERAVARAMALAPDDPQVLMIAARAARLTGDLDEAAELLDRVRTLEPGNMEAQFQRALLHERGGELEAARELALGAARRWPSATLWFNTGDLLTRLGDTDAARRAIEAGLEREPESFDGRSRLAQLELVHGDLERAVELYGALVERSPEPAELNNLGTALMMIGRYDEAIVHFETVVEHSPASASAVLNLADVEILSGDTERARELYRDVLEIVAADPRPDRLAAVAAQAEAHLGRADEAIERIQVALRAAPDHPWTAYQAALVYCVLGDRASALWHARRALEAGLEPRWLELEFFEPLWPSLEQITPSA